MIVSQYTKKHRTICVILILPFLFVNLFIVARSISKRLLKTIVNTMPISQCNETLLKYNQERNLPAFREGVNERQYCAWDPYGVSDSCQGDSGGPLQLDPYDDVTPIKIVGVVSFGAACGTRLPSIYSRVASYVDWIGSHVWPNGEIIPPLMRNE